MPYVEFRPAPALAHLVKCIWVFEAESGQAYGRPERIIPDGNPELVVHFGHPFGALTPSGLYKPQPRAFLMGQMTQPVTLDASQGAAGVAGVRFHPASARAALGAAMDEISDQHLKVEDFDPGAAEGLVDEVASAPTAAARAWALQRYVADRAKRTERFQDATVQGWLSRIAAANGLMSISDLATDSGLSIRQLERRFLKQIGVPPRQFANVIRFRRVFDLLTYGGRQDWARLALEAGYYDQSHLIRDFHRYIGCSPSQFVSQMRGLSAVLIGLDEETACRVVTRRETLA
ncbi:MAG: helix-turn-helix domain-containing protein [Alphaproteobacteria bacterium]|nr:helix-turn-helix domain-containing protein [Alphaproteobacteria bacterium]